MQLGKANGGRKSLTSFLLQEILLIELLSAFAWHGIQHQGSDRSLSPTINLGSPEHPGSDQNRHA